MNLPLTSTSIIHSNLTRATESARLISEHLPQIPVLPCDEEIRECIPCEADPPGSKWYPEHVYFTDGARQEGTRCYFSIIKGGPEKCILLP